MELFRLNILYHQLISCLESVILGFEACYGRVGKIREVRGPEIAGNGRRPQGNYGAGGGLCDLHGGIIIFFQYCDPLLTLILNAIGFFYPADILNFSLKTSSL